MEPEERAERRGLDLRSNRWLLFSHRERDWLRRLIEGDELPTDTRTRMLAEIEVADKTVLRETVNQP